MSFVADIAIFGAFFLLALVFRQAPAMHRRAMLCASVALTGAAVGRVLPSDSLGYLLVWLAPLIAAIAVDVVSERRVHPVLIAGAIAFLFMFFKVSLYAGSARASAIGDAIIGPLL